MKMLYLSGKEDGIKDLANVAFPSYRGRKFKWTVAEEVEMPDTAWSGGSRSTYAGVNLTTRRSATLPNFNPSEFGGPPTTPVVPVRPGMAIVEHSIFCGKDMGLTFYVHPSDAPRLLPPTENLHDNEKIVLAFSRIKNTYGGQKNVRFLEARRRYGITLDRWNTARESLIAKKMLTKAGALTPEGRNQDTGSFCY